MRQTLQKQAEAELATVTAAFQASKADMNRVGHLTCLVYQGVHNQKQLTAIKNAAKKLMEENSREKI